MDRVVTSSYLSKSPLLARFLRFVVEETLAGKADRIKAYTIAADALGRDAGFDAENDPIVRVSAGRLRRALDHYYMDGGHNDPVIIELPLGSYVPVFQPNTGRQRVKTRFQIARKRIARAVRENYRLVILIVVIAMTVSLSLDIFWRLVDGRIPSLQTSQPAPAARDATGSLRP